MHLLSMVSAFWDNFTRLFVWLKFKKQPSFTPVFETKKIYHCSS